MLIDYVRTDEKNVYYYL